MKKQLWIWPIIAVVVLSIVGFSVRSAIESTMEEDTRSELETLLDVETAMLEQWFEVQMAHAESAANALPFCQAVYKLLDSRGETESADQAIALADIHSGELRTDS